MAGSANAQLGQIGGHVNAEGLLKAQPQYAWSVVKYNNRLLFEAGVATGNKDFSGEVVLPIIAVVLMHCLAPVVYCVGAFLSVRRGCIIVDRGT